MPRCEPGRLCDDGNIIIIIIDGTHGFYDPTEGGTRLDGVWPRTDAQAIRSPLWALPRGDGFGTFDIDEICGRPLPFHQTTLARHRMLPCPKIEPRIGDISFYLPTNADFKSLAYQRCVSHDWIHFRVVSLPLEASTSRLFHVMIYG
jgi:hypothetical protein